MATSTMTDPFFIRLTIWRVTSFGADAPGISTPPITKSASAVARAMEYEFDACVRTTPPKMSSSSRSRFRYRRQMKIGEQHQARPEVRDLLLHRLLDLHDHVGALPYHLCRANNLRSRFLIFRVRHRRAFARLGLHQYLVSGIHQRLPPGRHDAYAPLLVLNFFGNADNHVCCLLTLIVPKEWPVVTARL